MKHLVVVASLVVVPSVSFAQEGAVAQTERNEALVMRFYEEAWHNDNYSVADEIFAPDYVRHDGSDPMQGPGAAILQSERAREVKTVVPDLRYDYDVIMADEDMVAVRWTSRGNVAGVPALMRRFVGKSGPVVTTGANMYRFRDGRVVEVWNNRDDLTIQRAMGTFRWYAVAGFLIGVLTTMLGGWAVRRWRSARSDVESAGAHARMSQPLLWTLLVTLFTGGTARPAGVAPMRHVDRHSTGAVIMRLLIPTLVLLLMPLDGRAQQRLPIIDVHLHAYRAAAMGPPPVAMCTPIRSFPAWDPAQPYGPVFMTWLKEPPCDDPVWSPMTDQALMDETLVVMERLNIVGVVSGTADRVERWRAAAPERVIPGLQFNVARDTAITPDSLRRLHEADRLSVFGEVTNQYAGVAPDDQRMEPYWALAEELDVPVGIHVGGGPPGVIYLGSEGYRARLQSALTMEEVLVRHPRLRVYLAHAGNPLLDDLLALLHAHPQVYVDIGFIGYGLQPAVFYRYLQGILDAGYGNRVMFGSDQMVWPGVIERAVAVIEEAPFLSEEQKRDILYNNAARFLRLTEEEIARHHGRYEP